MVCRAGTWPCRRRGPSLRRTRHATRRMRRRVHRHRRQGRSSPAESKDRYWTLIVPFIDAGCTVQLKYHEPGAAVLKVSVFVPWKVPVSAIFAEAVPAVASASDFHTVKVCGMPTSLLSMSTLIGEL